MRDKMERDGAIASSGRRRHCGERPQGRALAALKLGEHRRDAFAIAQRRDALAERVARCVSMAAKIA
jgi:hypothetical protein